MPIELMQEMAGCGDCRNLAVDYGMRLSLSRRYGASPHDSRLPLQLSESELRDHLITVHPEWLPDRQQDCATCDAWRRDHTTGPIEEVEAWHRVWHLCEPLRKDGNEQELRRLM